LALGPGEQTKQAENFKAQGFGHAPPPAVIKANMADIP